MSDKHFCQVCGKDGHSHDSRPFGVTVFFLTPCCKGCGCESYEEALQHATPDELAEIARNEA